MRGFQVWPVEDEPHLWAVSVSYFSPKLNQLVKRVPGAYWDGKRRLHVGYVDAIEQVVARLKEQGLNTEEVPPNKREWPHNLPASYESARDYQRIGIDFLINQAGSGALLADDMGVGKSFQTVKAVRALRRKTVIVCPAHVRGVWERPKSLDDKGGELAKWWPDANVFAPYGTKSEEIPEEADVFVTHYDIVHAWVDAVIKWGRGKLTSVFDEAQILLNPTSRRSKACREIAAESLGRIALTGTPPIEYIKDFYNVVETISPGRFGDFFQYGIRYCDGQKRDVPGPGGTMRTVWDFSGTSNKKEMRQRLDWFCLRRTKREVLKELPAMQRQVVDVEVPARNRLGVDARLVGDKRRMRMALDSAADGKFKSVLRLIRDHLEAGQRVVVGTYRRAVCEAVADAMSEFAPSAYIHGGIPLTRRPKIITDLAKKKGPVCLAANIDCTSTGIDLTFASIGVIAELVWEPRELVQWEARLHRFGQQEPVLIQYVIARGTGDELILQAVINKLDNFLDLFETDKGDGLKETLAGDKDEGLSRLAAALKKMGKKAKAA
jgi:SNF2 family DNA or RNA helicase